MKALLLVAEFVGRGSPPPYSPINHIPSNTTSHLEFRGGPQGRRTPALATSISGHRPTTTRRTTTPTSTPTQPSRDCPPPRPRTTVLTPRPANTQDNTDSGSGNISLLGCIEVLRRRATKEGKVKIKLSLCG